MILFFAFTSGSPHACQRQPTGNDECDCGCFVCFLVFIIVIHIKKLSAVVVAICPGTFCVCVVCVCARYNKNLFQELKKKEKRCEPNCPKSVCRTCSRQTAGIKKSAGIEYAPRNPQENPTRKHTRIAVLVCNSI